MKLSAARLFASATVLTLLACSSDAISPPAASGVGGVSNAGAGGSPAGSAGNVNNSGGGGSGAGGKPSAGQGGGLAMAGAASAGAGAGAGSVSEARPWRPASGRSYLLIGQSGSRALTEYQATVKSGVAGGSVYGDIYHGALNNDAQLAFVDLLAAQQPGALVELGLSWKDALAANGYVKIDGSQPANFRTVGIEEQIVAGKFDPQLDAIASLMKAHAQLKFLLRIDYEVSNNFHCNTDPAGWNFETKDCSYYVKAFDYIAARLRETDAVSNVAFVYHPVRGQAELLYPGPKYVDWVGFSVFNNDLCLPVSDDNGSVNGCPPADPADSGLTHDIEWAGAQGKPVLIAESSVQRAFDQSATGFVAYLDRLFGLVARYPQVGGLTYINIDWQNDWIPGEAWTGPFACDSRVQRYPETLARWCTELGKGRFLDSAGATVACAAQ